MFWKRKKKQPECCGSCKFYTRTTVLTNRLSEIQLGTCTQPLTDNMVSAWSNFSQNGWSRVPVNISFSPTFCCNNYKAKI